MKLNTKILLVIIPILIISISSIGFIAFKRLNETSLASSINHRQTLLETLQLDIKSFENTTRSNLELFSNDSLLQKYVISDEEHRYNLLLPSLLRLFGSYQKAYPNYYEIRVIMPDGYEDARKINRDIRNLTEEEHNTPVVNIMMQSKNKISSFYTSNPDNNELSYYIAKPITIKDLGVDTLIATPKLRAYLSLTVSLNWLVDKINRTKAGETDITFITNSKGKVVISNNNKIPLYNNFVQLLNNSNDIEYVGNILNKRIESKNKIINISNIPGYLLSLPISSKLILFSWHPSKEIIDQSYQLGKRISLITLISITILSVFLFYLLKHLILNPIRHLQISTQSIGRGDLSEVIKVQSKDELGLLANSFNQMRETLLESHEQIKYLAYHDSLTGLPNRLMFLEYVTQAVALAKRNSEYLAILFLDLDDFKRVNDTLGHKAGDTLLKEVSDRILSCLRETDYVVTTDSELSNILARIGGDEFLILLHNIPDNFTPGTVAVRIIESLSDPISIDNIEFFVTASIGITVFPNDAQSAEDLIKNADIAMYHAKGLGKNCYDYYTDSMNSAMIERISIENKLRNALAKDQFFIVYQPQIDSSTGLVYGVEALIRWNDPDEGIISPVLFIPIAEKTGLIVEIDEWVLRKACLQAKLWQQQKCHNINISVNISAIQFSKVDLPVLISNILNETKLEPCYLKIEITETVIMEDIERVSKTLNKIRELGVSISLDDFGTGYSSLNYLRQFPLDILKIDRSFVSEIIDSSADKGAIIIAIIAMSHALNLKVIAEGIETELQYDKLVEWHCDIIQGHYLHRPLPAEEIEQLLLPETKNKTLAD